MIINNDEDGTRIVSTLVYLHEGNSDIFSDRINKLGQKYSVPLIELNLNVFNFYKLSFKSFFLT